MKKDPILGHKATEALQQLAESENPLLLGQQKTGPLKSYWAYPLDDACRILYNLNTPLNEINLHRICSHTESYGH